MGETRFRVWDEIGKHMYYPGEAKFCITMVGSVCDDETDDGGVLENRSYRMTALLSTGLKDKNGREIYGGDEIRFDAGKWRDACGGSPKHSTTQYVVWREYGWFPFIEEGYTGVIMWQPKDCEVIGNTYENPELVKGGNMKV